MYFGDKQDKNHVVFFFGIINKTSKQNLSERLWMKEKKSEISLYKW
jgi:hypothetical protein